jgi:acylphosphatase
MDERPIRATVLYSGTVQGVGFRWRTCRIAEDFDVTGYVRNLSDGRVELVAEGDSGVVEDFLAGLTESLDRYIQEQVVDWSPALHDRATFDVRR